MDFDHTCPPEGKLYNISQIHLQAGASKNLAEMLKAELAKGEYVCVNCHRKRTMLRQAYSKRIDYFQNPNSKKLNQASKYVYSILSKASCVDCKNNSFLSLEFDHVQGKKNRDISFMIGKNKGYSIQDLKDEITKCEIRCANCHREKTLKRNNGLEETDQIPKSITSVLCSCGNRKTRNAKHCRSCVQEEKSTGQQEKFGSVENIISLLSKKNYVQLARDLNVTDNAIRKYLSKNGVDPKSLRLKLADKI
jgi:hypothetical protein